LIVFYISFEYIKNSPKSTKTLDHIPFFVYIKSDFVKPDSVERREYQVNIARTAEKENTLVVLPTGLGKTIIALMLVVQQLKKDQDKILFWHQQNHWSYNMLNF